MGYRHTREEILDGALDVALRDGLSQLTFGRVAQHVRVSDRIVVYYFPTKNDLIEQVLAALALRLQEVLAAAFTEPARDHLAVARAAWPVLARPALDSVFAIFFEANGLAAAKRTPYATVVPTLVHLWVDWVAGLVDGTPAEQRREAEAAIALIDGLLLLRLIGGAAAANRAAERLGIR